MNWFINRKIDPVEFFGYPKDQQGVIHRYLREIENWRSHLENSQRYIVQFCREIPPVSSIAILGSGWLLDIPLEFLLKNFETIYLIDICHPTQVKHKMRSYPRIQLIEKELTGYIHQLPSLVSRKDFQVEMLNELSNNGFDPFADIRPGAIVSLNLLTQLDGILNDYMNEHHRGIEEAMIPFRKKIQEEHIRMISPYPSCIISDTEEIYTTPKGEIMSRRPTLFAEWPKNRYSRGWNWNFDTQKTFHEHLNTTFRVEATMLI